MAENLSNIWNVGTRLIPNEEISKCEGRGYVPRLPGSNIYFKTNVTRDIKLAVDSPMYLNCPYEKIDEYLNRTYQGQCCGHSFFYSLRRSYTFIEEIEHNLLSKVAWLYKINCPLIFAPEARRAVDICIIDGLTSDELAANSSSASETSIDATTLAAAGWQIDILDGTLITNHRLVLTNLQISKQPQDFSNDGEDKDGQRYFDIKENLSARTLIIPETSSLKQNVRKIVAGDMGNSFRVYVNDDVDLRKYRTLTFNELSADDWVNLHYDITDLPRLRTAGDVDNFCRGFVDVKRGYDCYFSCVKQPKDSAPKNVIRRYERRDRYPDWGKTQELFQSRRYRPICYLHFRGEGNYFGDWAEYVLEACEHEYPEFSWAGVTDET